MTTFEDFLPKLARELDRLSPRHRLAFSAACCQRALPNLQAYARQMRSIDASAVGQALEEVWEFVEGTRSALNVVQLRQACECQLPPPDDDHVLASAASNTVQMVDLLLQQAVEPRAWRSKEIAGWAQATVDGYLQTGPESIEDQDSLVPHPLMQRELARQEADLAWLKRQGVLSRDLLEYLRARAISDGGSLDFTPWALR